MYFVKPLSGSSCTARCSALTACSCCPTSACTAPKASKYSTFCTGTLFAESQNGLLAC